MEGNGGAFILLQRIRFLFRSGLLRDLYKCLEMEATVRYQGITAERIVVHSDSQLKNLVVWVLSIYFPPS